MGISAVGWISASTIESSNTPSPPFSTLGALWYPRRKTTRYALTISARLAMLIGKCGLVYEA